MLFAADSFKGRNIVVTGASSGIGRATAVLLASLGARICLIARREEGLVEALSELPNPTDHTILAFDLANTAEIGEAMRRAASTLGPISGLVHAAGVESIVPIKVMRDSHIAQLLQSSAVASIMLVKAISSSSVIDTSQDCAVVLMSSVAAQRGHQGLAAYSAAKAAVDGAARSLAVELAPKRIRVNTIAAAAVETPMHSRTLSSLSEKAVQAYSARHPLGFGRPEDIANAACFLLSPASRWMTGATLSVDGGFLCV